MGGSMMQAHGAVQEVQGKAGFRRDVSGTGKGGWINANVVGVRPFCGRPTRGWKGGMNRTRTTRRSPHACHVKIICLMALPEMWPAPIRSGLATFPNARDRRAPRKNPGGVAAPPGHHLGIQEAAVAARSSARMSTSTPGVVRKTIMLRCAAV